MEDRWTAIRWAVGTAQKNDCIVIAGKGAEDFQEWDVGFGLVKVRSLISLCLSDQSYLHRLLESM